MSRSILARAAAGALRRAAEGNVLLALDFDGTLAPLVRSPAAARMRPRTRALLRQATSLYPTVVLTGRSRADAARRMAGVTGLTVVGNHGLEGVGVGRARGVRDEARLIVRRWRRALGPVRRLAGVEVEDKGASLAIHLRGTPDAVAARRRVERLARRLEPSPRIVGGKAIVNLLPDLDVNKGTALRAIIRSRRARGAIYVGDDVTDEDVFALPASVRVLTIRVGSARSRARYRIRSQRDIDRLLALLVALRRTA